MNLFFIVYFKKFCLKDSCLPGSFYCKDNILSSCGLNNSWVSIDCPPKTVCTIEKDKAYCKAVQEEPKTSKKLSTEKMNRVLDKLDAILSNLELFQDSDNDPKNIENGNNKLASEDSENPKLPDVDKSNSEETSPDKDDKEGKKEPEVKQKNSKRKRDKKRKEIFTTTTKTIKINKKKINSSDCNFSLDHDYECDEVVDKKIILRSTGEPPKRVKMPQNKRKQAEPYQLGRNRIGGVNRSTQTGNGLNMSSPRLGGQPGNLGNFNSTGGGLPLNSRMSSPGSLTILNQPMPSSLQPHPQNLGPQAKPTGQQNIQLPSNQNNQPAGQTNTNPSAQPGSASSPPQDKPSNGASPNNSSGPSNSSQGSKPSNSSSPGGTGTPGNGSQSKPSGSSGSGSSNSTSHGKSSSSSGSNGSSGSSGSNGSSGSGSSSNTSQNKPEGSSNAQQKQPTPSTSQGKDSSQNKNQQNGGSTNNKSTADDKSKSSATSSSSSDSKSSSNSKSGNGNGGGGSITTDQIIEATKAAGYDPNPEYADAVSAGIGNVDQKQQGMFLAQVIFESGGLAQIEEEKCKGNKCPDEYKDENGVEGKQYYGRGFIQLTWAANYKKASEELGMGDELLQNPEKVAEDPNLAMDVSVWFWNANVAVDSGVQNNQFGSSTKMINGQVECTGNNVDKSKKRYEIYKKVAETLNITDLATEEGCY